MINNTIQLPGQADALADRPHSHPAAKWAACIEDQVIPSPHRKVKVQVLKDQASISKGNVLVLDRNGDGDVGLQNDQLVDLAEGNVFYVVPACDAPKGEGCRNQPKLAYFVDDKYAVTIRANQTGSTLRELFALAPTALLFRDFESPEDHVIDTAQQINFADGPVFYTRRKHAGLTIYVNEKPFTDAQGVKAKMTGREIASLVVDDPDNYDVYALPGEEEIKLTDSIKVKDQSKFKVIRKTVTGGYEPARIERELETLRKGGAKVTFVSGVPAVVYHDIPARKGYPHLSSTDVLVTLPSGYPGQSLDGAYLPQGSPLFGRVVGQPQNQHAQALDRTWQLVSYHPHNGGGGPAWNKDKHGFHTYIDEIMTWVHRASQ